MSARTSSVGLSAGTVPAPSLGRGPVNWVITSPWDCQDLGWITLDGNVTDDY